MPHAACRIVGCQSPPSRGRLGGATPNKFHGASRLRHFPRRVKPRVLHPCNDACRYAGLMTFLMTRQSRKEKSLSESIT